jgi:hypothetical protein
MPQLLLLVAFSISLSASPAHIKKAAMLDIYSLREAREAE